MQPAPPASAGQLASLLAVLLERYTSPPRLAALSVKTVAVIMATEEPRK